MSSTSPTTPRPTDPKKGLKRRGRKPTARRLAKAAVFSAVRGLAYALGTTVGTALVGLAWWWISSR